MKKIDFLKNLYYSPKSKYLYGGVDSLLRAARIKFPDITRKEVEFFLKKQTSYALNQNVIRKFPRDSTRGDAKFSHWLVIYRCAHFPLQSRRPHVSPRRSWFPLRSCFG
jgi:hypothetical protein